MRKAELSLFDMFLLFVLFTLVLCGLLTIQQDIKQNCQCQQEEITK